MSLPLKNYHSYELYVADLDKSVKFHEDVFGFCVVGKSTPAAEEELGMRRVVMSGGPNVNFIISQPLKDFSVAAQYLKLHPEGTAFLNFRVNDFEAAHHFLKKNRATFLHAPVEVKNEQGKFRQFAIATPLNDVGMRFVDDSNFKGFAPGFEMSKDIKKIKAPMGIECIDHMTCNVKTMQPLESFLEHVLGFEKFWEIDFHTNDINPKLSLGSGLKSVVMWHPDSGIKFANNEPAPPFFRNSQIDIYLRDNRGSGVQHIAFRVEKIIPVVQAMREKGVKFLDAPQSYYDRVPSRLKEAGFTGRVAEKMTDLAKESILVDGSAKGYLLQIFSKEMNMLTKNADGGALFYEIIQREGDDGFGYGNFRALFETIEQGQIAELKTSDRLPLELI